MPKNMTPPAAKIRSFRRQLASVDALPQLAVMGVVTGLITAVVIALFQQLIAFMTHLLTNDAEGLFFESLPWQMRLLLPFSGAMMVVIIALICRKNHYQAVGVVHVIERLDWHQGRLRLGNFLYQFFAGAAVIATGHSIGREGPAIHLGAAAASIMGRCLRLPNNSLPILVACGAAAAISATFNTPVAGVMFAMEVLLVEYTVGGFLPVLLASATAAVMIQSVYGYAPAIVLPSITIDAIHELPMVIAIGIAAGLLGAIYCRQIVSSNQKTQHWSLHIRLLMAAAITGLLAIPSPAIMGVGNDTMSILAQGGQSLSFIITLLICKMVATTFSIGLGVPGGLIGPALMTGAIIGALVADISLLIPEFATQSVGFLVTVGMGAMLGAVLQAPLTALMTVLELTRNPELPFPALVAIAIATLVASLIMRHRGIFEQLLDTRGLKRLRNPLRQALSHEGVTTVMEERFMVMERFESPIRLADQIDACYPWLLIYDNGQPLAVVETNSIIALLTEAQLTTEDHNQPIDLLNVPALRYQTHHIKSRASALEALNRMDKLGIESLYVIEPHRDTSMQPVGIITRSSLHHRFYP